MRYITLMLVLLASLIAATDAHAQLAGAWPVHLDQGSMAAYDYDVTDGSADIDLTAKSQVAYVVKNGADITSTTLRRYDCDDSEMTCSDGNFTLTTPVDSLACTSYCWHELQVTESGESSYRVWLKGPLQIHSFGIAGSAVQTGTITVSSGAATLTTGAVVQASSVAPSWMLGATERTPASGDRFPFLDDTDSTWVWLDFDDFPSGGGSGDNFSVNGTALTNVNLTDSTEIGYAFNRTASPDEVSPYIVTGSIANAKLANSSVSYGGVSVSLGGSDATPAFNLADATGYLVTSLSGTLANLNTALGSSIADGAHFSPSTLAADYSIGGTADATTFVRGDGTYAVPDIVNDTTPELGGDLGAGGNNITSLGDVTFKTGAAGGTLRTGTSNADKFQLQAYDVDNGVYRTLLEADAGNDVVMQLFTDYFQFEDATDNTKIAKFDASGITTSTTRTFTFPDASGTFSLGSHLTASDARSALIENGASEMLGETLGTACTENQILKANASGGLDCATDATGGGSPTFDGIGTGTNTTATMTVGTGASITTSGSGTISATTAAALAANGANCSAGQYPLGVDASGAAEGCTADDTGTDDQNAGEVAFTPAGGVAASDVQAAIEEVDAEHTTDTDFSDTATHEQIPFDRSDSVAGTDSLKWDGSAGTLVILGDITVDGASVQTGTDDDVPESGDFGNAADLESTGALSDDVVAAAEMADADHGDVSWTGGVATVDNVAKANVAGAPTGDFVGTSDTQTLTNKTIDGDDNTLQDIPVSALTTEVRSFIWPAGAMVADETNCAAPATNTIGTNGPMYTVICTDNDGSTIYGDLVMPDSWDGGTVTFELTVIQDAADTSNLQGDVSAQCRGDGETAGGFGTEIPLDLDTLTGSDAVDQGTSAAVTPAGTCAGGDFLQWRWQMDATGTTTAVATLNIVGMKIEYVSTIGD